MGDIPHVKTTAVAAAARELRLVRAEALPKLEGDLRALNAAVLAAYGFSAKKDLLAQLLELNLFVAQRLEQAAPVIGPGIPAAFPNPETLVSDDCIRPPVME